MWVATSGGSSSVIATALYAHEHSLTRFLKVRLNRQETLFGSIDFF
jgi:hypothetical protein